MTDEEMAEEYAITNWEWYEDGQRDYIAIKRAFLAGLKAGSPKWHKVADGDLPKYGYQVLSEEGVPVIYNRDTNRWFEYSPNADNIELRKWEEPIAWCEIPEYEDK